MQLINRFCGEDEINSPTEPLPEGVYPYGRSSLPFSPLAELNEDYVADRVPRARVLLVEDDPLIRENLVEILLLEGYEVIPAVDGLHALELLRDQPAPDLVVTDLQMPRANGWVLAMELRREPRLARLPLVVISGVHDSRSAGGFLGASATFQKPFDLSEFLGTLERLLEPQPGG